MVLYQELGAVNNIEPQKLYKVKSVHIKVGTFLHKGKKIFVACGNSDSNSIVIRSKIEGLVSKVLVCQNDEITSKTKLIEVKACIHPTVLGNICCDCGTVLEDNTEKDCIDHVAMLHSIPSLRVSKEEATRLGQEDIQNLLDRRKLVLLVDLDQTLVHTTNDNVPPKLKDVCHFKLIANGHWYHTRLRPYTCSFLEKMSKLYELHICTFGVREYAHYIARFLDPDRKLFGDRILSRNECLDPMSKKANLSSLFPCGDNLACIIDDRSDVWNFAPNVVQVMPYHFFKHTGDINAPPGLQKMENDDSDGFDFSKIEENDSYKSSVTGEKSNIVTSNGTKMNDKSTSEDVNETKSGSDSATQCDSDLQSKVLPQESKSAEKKSDLAIQCDSDLQSKVLPQESKSAEKKYDIAIQCDSDLQSKVLPQESKSAETKSNLAIQCDSDLQSKVLPQESKSAEKKSDLAIQWDSDLQSKVLTQESKSAEKKSDFEQPSANPPSVVTQETEIVLQESNEAEESVKVYQASVNSKEESNKSVEENVESAVVAEDKITEKSFEQKPLSNKPLDKLKQLNETLNKTGSLDSTQDTLSLDLTLEPDSNPDLLDVPDSDDYLLYLEDILTNLHTEFYKMYDSVNAKNCIKKSVKSKSKEEFKTKSREKKEKDENGTFFIPDLKEIVPGIRKRTLKNCNIVMSHVIPHNSKLEDAKAYHIAVSLGATVTEKIFPKSKDKTNKKNVPFTTHLIAANKNTEKYYVAKKVKNIKIVTPNWLWSCAERWEKVEEKVFALTSEAEKTLSREPPLHCLVYVDKSKKKKNRESKRRHKLHSRHSKGKKKEEFNDNFPAPYSDENELDLNNFPEPFLEHDEKLDTKVESQTSLMEVNPMAFFSNDETKSMEDEVDDLLSDDEEYKIPCTTREKETEIDSSEHSSNEEELNNTSDSDEDEFGTKNKKRKFENSDSEDDELPSIKFRHGGSLPSSDSSQSGDEDDDMNEFGDILERKLMEG